MQIHPARLAQHLEMIFTASRSFDPDKRPVVVVVGGQAMLDAAVNTVQLEHPGAYRSPNEWVTLDASGVIDPASLKALLEQSWKTNADPESAEQRLSTRFGQEEKPPLSQRNLLSLKPFGPRVTVLRDAVSLISADTAGARAAMRALENLAAEGARLLVFAPPCPYRSDLNGGTWSLQANTLLEVGASDGTPRVEASAARAGRLSEPQVRLTLGGYAVTLDAWSLQSSRDVSHALAQGVLKGALGERLTFGLRGDSSAPIDLLSVRTETETLSFLTEPPEEDSRKGSDTSHLGELLAAAAQTRPDETMPTDAWRPFHAPDLKESGVVRTYQRAHETLRVTVQTGAKRASALATAERYEEKSGRWVNVARLLRGEIPAWTQTDQDEPLRAAVETLLARVATTPLSREPERR